jgi:hypothetical protein
MKYRLSFAIMLCSLSVCAAPTAPRDILAAMAEQLKQARSFPVGQAKKFQCPDGLNRLNGVQDPAVLAVLPAPDFVEKKAAAKVVILLNRFHSHAGNARQHEATDKGMGLSDHNARL